VTKVCQLLSYDHPIIEITAVGLKISNIVCLSTDNNKMLNITNRDEGGFGNTDIMTKQLTSIRDKQKVEDLVRIDFSDSVLCHFGKISTYQVDNSNTFIICVFESSKIGLFDLEKSHLIKSISSAPGVSLEHVYIDDLSSFMACLD